MNICGKSSLYEFRWDQIQRARQRIHTSHLHIPPTLPPSHAPGCTSTPTGTITSKSDTRLHGQLAAVEVKVSTANLLIGTRKAALLSGVTSPVTSCTKALPNSQASCFSLNLPNSFVSPFQPILWNILNSGKTFSL